MKFTTASKQEETSGVKMLVYGKAGMGKTVLMATLPKPILVSAESGTLSLKRKNLERIYGVGNPAVTYDMPMIVIESMDDLIQAYTFLKSEKANQFLSVGFDSLSEIAESILANEKKLTKDPRKAYGEIIDKVEAMVRSYRDLPGKNVCFTAKMEMSKDALTGYDKLGPSMPGTKLGPNLTYFFDEMFQFTHVKDKEGKEHRVLLTQPDLQNEAKDRSGSLALYEAPNLTTIINKIKGV